MPRTRKMLRAELDKFLDADETDTDNYIRIAELAEDLLEETDPFKR